MDVPLFRGKALLDLKVFVAPIGADLEFHVVRPDWDTRPQPTFVDSQTGVPVTPLPVENINGWSGLRRFFRIAIEREDGTPVTTVFRPFCPNSYERTRVDDSGPLLPRYPTSCRSFSPFTRGMVWGIEQGWATSAFGGDELDGFRRNLVPLAPGPYRARVEIMPFFQVFFGIAPEDAEVTVDFVVADEGYDYDPRSPEGRLAAAGREAAGGVPPTDTDPDPETVPDLAALPAWNAYLRRQRGHDLLMFASTAWNAGPAPLVVEGFRRPGTTLMDAYQYFFDSHGLVVSRAPVGTFSYDTRRGHHHWHIPQFTRYTIVDVSTNEVVRSRKQSFCLAPTDAIDLTVPGAAYAPYAAGVSSVCGGKDARWIREVLPAGWGDTYYQGVAGQAFDVTSLPNGRYRMRVSMNPLGILYETSRANNVEDRYFWLRGRAGNRFVELEPWHSIRR